MQALKTLDETRSRAVSSRRVGRSGDDEVRTGRAERGEASGSNRRGRRAVADQGRRWTTTLYVWKMMAGAKPTGPCVPRPQTNLN